MNTLRVEKVKEELEALMSKLDSASIKEEETYPCIITSSDLLDVTKKIEGVRLPIAKDLYINKYSICVTPTMFKRLKQEISEGKVGDEIKFSGYIVLTD